MSEEITNYHLMEKLGGIDGRLTEMREEHAEDMERLDIRLASLESWRNMIRGMWLVIAGLGAWVLAKVKFNIGVGTST